MPEHHQEIAYTVTATLPDEATASEYVTWLGQGHVSHVISGGAASAHVVRVTDPATPICVEVRYLFPTRADLQAYLAHHAPRLRAEGLSRFPIELGIRFTRSVGTVELLS